MVTEEEIKAEYEAGASYADLAKKYRMGIKALAKIT